MKNKSGRTEIAKRSLQIIEDGFYLFGNEDKVIVKDKIAHSVAQTRTYTPEAIHALKEEVLAKDKDKFDCSIEVWNCSTIEALQKVAGGSKVGVLNFASAKNPGGGFLGGASAQEESLARSSSLYAALTKDWNMYEYNRSRTTLLYSDYLIYSPETIFWFNDEGDFLPELLVADVITSPAPNRGAILQNNREDELELLPGVFKERIMQVLSIAYKHGCDTLILGAWGCGVFRNEPADVAAYFDEVIGSHFRSAFKRIVFAIYDRSKEGVNIQAFKNIHHNQAPKGGTSYGKLTK